MPGCPIEEIRVIIRNNDRLFLGIFHIGLNLSGRKRNPLPFRAPEDPDYNTIPHFLRDFSK